VSRRALIPLLLCLATLAAACQSRAEREAVDEASIQAMLEQFLPLLGAAYGSGEIESLRPYAAEKELARIQTVVSGLADQGRYLEPKFLRLTIEDSHLWNHSNAFVTTLEVWDVRLHALGSGELLAEEPEKSYRVKYQLKRDAGSWRVLFRGIQE
jgi:ARC6-like, IMS domain